MRRFLMLIPLLILVGCTATAVKSSRQPLPAPQPLPANLEILVFSSKTCPACLRDKPQVDQMRRQGVQVTEIDTDEHPELVRQYRIRTLPTYVVLKDGVEIQRTGDIFLILSIISLVLKILVPIVLPILIG